MKKFLLLFILLTVLISDSSAQFTRYLVRLKNKGGSTHTLANPQTYLSQRAIDRRVRYGIAIDSTDLPVPQAYVDQIRNVPNITVLNVSKWLNAISIQTTDPNAIATINGFAFVQSTGAIAGRMNATNNNKFSLENNTTPVPATALTQRVTADYFNYGAASFAEIHLHNGEFLHNIGLRGQNMSIAMLDGGFFNYHTLDAMDSIIINNQVLSTWDFVARHASVSEDNSHGMQCLSTIAANIPGQFIGKAPKAFFHLFRTEDVATEYPIEEHNWVCGAERADSSGADVISSSVGYADLMSDPSFDHTYAQMDGNTTIAAIGADLAAKKGLLVFNSIGNEGTEAWHFLVTPSDGDSVVAVGAVSSAGNLGGFSGYGPSSDGQIKPDLASVGVAALIQTSANTVGANNGTSFACPNMAGLSTCLWQGFPEYNNMKILNAMRNAGTRASNPDDRVGYGIPNMKTAFSSLLIEFATSTSTIDTCSATVRWTTKDMSAMRYEIERKLPGQSGYTKVGDVAAQAGDLLAIKNYQFTNTIVASPAGQASYRIRQVIDTASASFTGVYIDTTNVTIGANCFLNFLIANASSSIALNGCNATINWTSRDNAAMKYEIERKVPGETNYTKVGEVTAQASNNVSNHSYTFNNTIISNNPGVVSYRIRQIVDTTTANFTAVYIDTVNVTISSGCFATGNPNIDPNKISIIIQPNPTTGDNALLTVETPFAITNMPIGLYDSKGRLVLQIASSKSTGKKTIDLSIGRLSRGKYYVKVWNGNTALGTVELIKL